MCCFWFLGLKSDVKGHFSTVSYTLCPVTMKFCGLPRGCSGDNNKYDSTAIVSLTDVLLSRTQLLSSSRYILVVWQCKCDMQLLSLAIESCKVQLFTAYVSAIDVHHVLSWGHKPQGGRVCAGVDAPDAIATGGQGTHEGHPSGFTPGRPTGGVSPGA